MQTTDDEAGSAAAGADSDSDLDLSTTKKPIQTQSRLAGGGIFRKSQPSSCTANGSSSKRPRLKSGTPRATLVVAPMTLISQWCDELERSSKGGELRVLMYYGNKRESGADLQQEIDGGVDVVVTRCAQCPEALGVVVDAACVRSYGTLCSDFKQSGFDTPAQPSKEKAADDAAKKSKGKGKGKEKEDKPKSKKKKPKGLFAIDWFRVGALRYHTRAQEVLTRDYHSPRRGPPHQVADDAEREGQLCAQRRETLGADRYSYRQVRKTLLLQKN